MSLSVFAFAIEGLPYLFATAPIEGVSESVLVVEGDTAAGLPIWTEDVDPLTSEASVGVFEVILAQDATARDVFTYAEPLAIGSLAKNLTSSGTTISVTPDLDLSAGDYIYIQQETLRISAATTPSGGFQRWVVTRAQAGSTARAYYPETTITEDAEIFLRAPALKGRKVTLYEYHLHEDGTVASSAALPFCGVVRDYGFTDGSDQARLRIGGFVGLLADLRLPTREWAARCTTPPMSEQRPWTAKAVATVRAAYEGAAPLREPYPVTKASELFTTEYTDGDEILVTYMGSLFVARWYSAPQRVEFNPLVTYRQMTEQIERSRLWGEDFKTALVTEVIGSGDVPNSLGTNAIGVLMALLTSTRAGDNGPWDRGMDLGIGIPIDFFAAEEIAGLESRVGGAMAVGRFFIGLEGDRERTVEDMALSLMRPFGLVWGASLEDLGRITLRPFSDVWAQRYQATAVTDADLIEEHISQQWRHEEVADVVKYTFSPYTTTLDNGVFVRIEDAAYPKRARGGAKSLDVDASVVESPPTAYYEANERLRWVRRPRPQVTFMTTTQTQLPVGGAVTVDFAQLVSEGSEDVGLRELVIVSKTTDLNRRTVTYKGWLLENVVTSRQPVTWSLLVESVAGDEVTVAENHFVPEPNGIYDGDIDPVEVGNVVRVYDAFGVTLGTAEVVAVDGGAGTVELDTVPVGTVAGCVIVLDNDDDDRWAFISQGDAYS